MACPATLPHVQVPPAPGQIAIGYEMEAAQSGCCKCEGLSQGGLIAVVILVIIFSPLAWIPCVMDSCYEVRPLCRATRLTVVHCMDAIKCFPETPCRPTYPRIPAPSSPPPPPNLLQPCQRPVYGWPAGAVPAAGSPPV